MSSANICTNSINIVVLYARRSMECYITFVLPLLLFNTKKKTNPFMLNLVSQAFTAHPVYSIRFQRVNCSVVHVERPPASKGCRTPPTTWTPIENKNIPQAKSRTNARIPVRRIDTRHEHEGHDTRHSSLISALKVAAFHCIGRVMFFFLYFSPSSQIFTSARSLAEGYASQP